MQFLLILLQTSNGSILVPIQNNAAVNMQIWLNHTNGKHQTTLQLPLKQISLFKRPVNPLASDKEWLVPVAEKLLLRHP